MQMVDFEFNGPRLSDFDMTVGAFDTSIDEIQENTGKVTINHVKAAHSDRWMSTGYLYEDPIVVEFSCIRRGCTNMNGVITDREFGQIMRWLNRKKDCKMKPIYDDGSFSDLYFMGTFNVDPIKVGNQIYGVSVEFTADAPYGYHEPVNYKYNSEDGDTFSVFDLSEEVGYIYCDMTIECLEGGDLTLSNSLDPDNSVVIKNCSSGEIITFNGRSKYVQTSLESHKKFFNDYNFNHPRIINTYDNNENIFTPSLSCNVTISYSPVMKTGVIL